MIFPSARSAPVLKPHSAGRAPRLRRSGGCDDRRDLVLDRPCGVWTGILLPRVTTVRSESGGVVSAKNE